MGQRRVELDAELVTLLEEDLANLAPNLHSVEVWVTWTEGTSEKQVTRVTYAWDSGPLYDQLGEEATGGVSGEAEEGAPQ